jgi:hypothetical protein
MTPVAIGFRVHSGWAALAAVAAPLQALQVIDRRRIELVDRAIRGSAQPFHAAKELPIDDAARLIERCTESSRLLACQALRTAIDELREKGYRVIASGVLLASGRALPALAATLASHALIHTAEGELFREVVAFASQRCELPVVKVKERELLERAGARLRVSAVELDDRLKEIGRSIGPPWRQDEKYAALVACLALADSGAAG